MVSELIRNLGRIPRRVIYTLTVIIIALPLLIPWNLPVSVEPMTKTFFDTIQSLEGTGKRILLLCCIMPEFWGEARHEYFAVVQHIFLLRDVKLIIGPIAGPPTVGLIHQLLFEVHNPLNKTYGVDYVVLPLIPAMEPALGALARDFRACYKTDERGTPIDELPIMKGVNTLDDFAIVIWGEPIKMSIMAARILYPQHPKVTYLVLCNTEGWTFVAPYVGPGMPYKSALWGIRPAAEYQLLYGGPYTEAVQYMDCLSGYHVLIIILIILGNVAAIAATKKREGQ